jgi:hypothetical protein
VLRRTTLRRHQPSTCFLAPTGSINLGFLLRENLLLYASHLPLGVPNGRVLIARITLHHTPPHTTRAGHTPRARATHHARACRHATAVHRRGRGGATVHGAPLSITFFFCFFNLTKKQLNKIYNMCNKINSM